MNCVKCGKLKINTSINKILKLLPLQGFGPEFWLGGQNPRRHPRIPRVYTYKDKEDLLIEIARNVSLEGEKFSIWRN